MKNKTKIQDLVIKLFLMILVFSTSVFFSKMYVNGDQYLYGQVYQYVGGKNLLQSYVYYASVLSKIEVIHFLVTVTGSKIGFDKAIYMSFFNVCLFFTGVRFLRSYDFSLPLSLLVLTTNFYIFALMFSAERLKFAVIFLFLFLSCHERERNKRISFGILAVTAHAQSAIFHVILLFEKLLIEMKKLVFSLKISKTYIFLLPIIIITGLTVIGPILKKVYFYITYYGDNVFLSVTKWGAFYAMTLLASKRKQLISIRFIVLLIPIVVLGAERLTIFCLLLFFMEHKYKTSYYFLVLYPLIVYFMVKSIGFLIKVYHYGDGYYH